MKEGSEELPKPGICHQIFLRFPHLSALFLAKTTQSPAPSSSTVTTHTLQVFSTPSHFRYCREIHCLIKKVTLASFIAGRMKKTIGYLLKKNFQNFQY